MLYIDLYAPVSSLCCMVLFETSLTSFLGEVLFFFPSLMAGPIYQPLVWHSNADTPLFTRLYDVDKFLESLGKALGKNLRKHTWIKILFSE